MGMWSINIRGMGVHHNKDLPADADRMAKKFVKELKDAGHLISDASITVGSAETLLDTTPPPAPPDEGKADG